MSDPDFPSRADDAYRRIVVRKATPAGFLRRAYLALHDVGQSCKRRQWADARRTLAELAACCRILAESLPGENEGAWKINDANAER